MTTFDKALKHTLGIEGGFSNDSRDSGGATRYGITEAKARAFGYTGDMKDLPLDFAKQIYKVDFWDIIRLDEVASISERTALEMFDTGVNCGVGIPAKFLQRVLNVLNQGGTTYPDLTVDGVMGRITIEALRAFLARRGKLGEDVLVEALNALQGAYYIELAERRPKDEAFMFGWLANRVVKRIAP